MFLGQFTFKGSAVNVKRLTVREQAAYEYHADRMKANEESDNDPRVRADAMLEMMKLLVDLSPSEIEGLSMAEFVELQTGSLAILKPGPAEIKAEEAVPGKSETPLQQ